MSLPTQTTQQNESEEIKMKKPFTLFDIQLLKESFNNATIANDCLPNFLNSYAFDSVFVVDCQVNLTHFFVET